MDFLNRKKYDKISFEQKKKLIELLSKEKYSMKKASEKLKIKFSTAKAIYRLYKSEGRIGKKAMRDRKIKKISKKQSVKNGISLERLQLDNSLCTEINKEKYRIPNCFSNINKIFKSDLYYGSHFQLSNTFVISENKEEPKKKFESYQFLEKNSILITNYPLFVRLQEKFGDI